MLDGSPALIELTPAEFDRVDSYLAKSLILRGAASRTGMVQMMLTANGCLESNLNAREPRPGEAVDWLQGGQFYDIRDNRVQIELGPSAVQMFTVPGRRSPRARHAISSPSIAQAVVSSGEAPPL